MATDASLYLIVRERPDGCVCAFNLWQLLQSSKQAVIMAYSSSILAAVLVSVGVAQVGSCLLDILI